MTAFTLLFCPSAPRTKNSDPAILLIGTASSGASLSLKTTVALVSDSGRIHTKWAWAEPARPASSTRLRVQGFMGAPSEEQCDAAQGMIQLSSACGEATGCA